MATWPAKTDYATGDVLSATNMNDIGNGLNDLYGESFTNNFYAGKNKIINGDFGIWQRGTTFTGITSGSFTADRFDSILTTSTCDVSQQTFTAGTAPVSGYEGNYFIRHVVTSGGTAGSRYLFEQKMEDVRTFAGQTVTISFWAKADASKNISVEFYQSFGAGGSSTVTGISPTKLAITTSWTRYSATISVPSVSGKTIGGSSFLAAAIWLDAGSDFNARTSSLGNQSGTFDFWGFQVEAGSTATPFQTATGTKQGELAACQRYYIRYSMGANTNQTGSPTGWGVSTTIAVIPYSMPVAMRTNPTSIEISNARLWDGVNVTNVTSAALAAATNQIGNIEFTVASGLTQYRPYRIIGTSSDGYVGINAEL